MGDEIDEDEVAALFMGEEDGGFGEGDDEEFLESHDGVLPITSSMGASSRGEQETPPSGPTGLFASHHLEGGGPPTLTLGPALTFLGSIAPTAFENEEYFKLAVGRSDGQLGGAVPVRFDVSCSAVLMALPAARMVAARLPQSIASPGDGRAAAR